MRSTESQFLNYYHGPIIRISTHFLKGEERPILGGSDNEDNNTGATYNSLVLMVRQILKRRTTKNLHSVALNNHTNHCLYNRLEKGFGFLNYLLKRNRTPFTMWLPTKKLKISTFRLGCLNNGFPNVFQVKEKKKLKTKI